MNLYIFNPEHEIALANGCKGVTYGHNVQELRMNLGWLPALWADDGDVVLVDDAAYAVKASKGYRRKSGNDKSPSKLPRIADVLFLEIDDIRGGRFDNILPWGWNTALTSELAAAGITAGNIPSEERIGEMRRAASRRQTTEMLRCIREGIETETCGEACYITSVDDIPTRPLHIVVKAPWSSSGRGVRYVDTNKISDNTIRWIGNVIRRQGGIMVEPYYDKVKDLAMEFRMHADGAEYCGLSLFMTYNGSYAGNLITTEEEKMKRLTRYVPMSLIEEVKRRVCTYADLHFRGIYEGPFGVDMMIVAGDGFLLHPCVEVNLRRTMGHVALALPASDALPDRVMSITHDVNYQLKISETENNFVQVL